MLAKAVVALGSNLPGRFGSKEAVLNAALAGFSKRQLTVEARSSPWRSAAWPDPRAPAFLNMVAVVRTALSPEAVLSALLALERQFGRVRSAPNAPRTLDLDLIDYDGRTIDLPGLVLPHPRGHERLFVMGPLAEIAPAWRHPVLSRTARQLADAAAIGRDAQPVRRVAT